MAYAAEFRTASSDPKFYGNKLVFATTEEAELYAKDLENRWLAVTEYRVVETDGTPNYTIKDGVMSSLEN